MSGSAGVRRAAPSRPRRRPTTERKLDHLLAVAAELIADRGFEAASIRDVGRRAGLSLAGMYYYFGSKEGLLHQIQYRTFESLLQAQEREAAQPGTAEERFRRLLAGHLRFFHRHPNEMKVCTYEFESLSGEFLRDTEELRRRYYHLMADVVAQLMNGGKPVRGPESARSRHVTLFVFGMLNWVFMWYDPAKDAPVEQLGEEMYELLMQGIPRLRRTDQPAPRSRAQRK